MNRIKRILTNLLIALVGAVLAIFLYTKLIGVPAQQVLIRESTPVQLASHVAPDNPQLQLPDLTKAAEKSVHAVVHIQVKMLEQNESEDNPLDWFFGWPGNGNNQRRYRQQTPQYAMASGSGVIISPDGYIVTNNHVVDDAVNVQVILNNNRQFKAKVIGRDPNTDIALVKIDATDLPYLSWGNSDALKLGEWVLAVGNPFSLTSTVTAGIVSAKSRGLGLYRDRDKMGIESFIQTDAAVNRGNSGGALVNVNGDLVGINAAIASETGNYSGYSFAIPSTIARKAVDDIRTYGEVRRARLGVEIITVNDSIAKAEKLSKVEGAFIGKIVKDGAAYKAGLKEGDIIVAVNGKSVASTSELQEQISKYSPGNEVTVDYIRNGDLKQVKVVLRSSKSETSLAKVSLSDLGAEFSPISNRDKARLQIDEGVQVTDLSSGKLKDAGVKIGFIITEINKVGVSSKEDVERVFASASGKKSIFIEGVYPNGEWTYYVIKPAS